MSLGIIAGLFAVALLWGMVEYNRLVRDNNRVKAAWSDIDVQLKRRHDLIPKLVEVVKTYADYERSSLAKMTELRSLGARLQNPSERQTVEQQISQHFGQFFVLAEHYPELKASSNFLDLQQNLSAVENDIQYARRYFNGAVRNLNVRVDAVPSNLVARLFSFNKAAFFSLEAIGFVAMPHSASNSNN